MSDKEIVQLLSKAFREHSPDALGLLEKLEDVEYSDGLLRPLHYAARYGHLEGCKALIKRGADINARTVLGNTPLEIAMQKQSDQHVNVIKLLLVAGAHGELTEPYADLIGGRAQLDRSRPQERKRRLPSALPSAKTTKVLKEDKVNQLLESASLKSWFDRHWPKLPSMFAREQRSALTDSTFSQELQAELTEGLSIELIERLTRLSPEDPCADLKLALLYFASGPAFNQDGIDTLKRYEKKIAESPTALRAEWLVARALALCSPIAAQASPQIAQALFQLFQYLNPTETEWLDSIHLRSVINRLKQVRKGADKGSQQVQATISLAEEWAQLSKRVPKAWSRTLQDPMNELIALVGLARVKRLALDLISAASVQRQLSQNAQVPQTLNFTLLGNPGTGKTTVARLLGRILHAIELRSSEQFKETSARKLMNEGLDELHALVEECKGGVLFIDEAYAFDPEKSAQGREIFEELLLIAELKREELSIIMAGYQRDMEQKLFAFNDGLASRFDRIVLEDFSEQELHQIWRLELKRREGWREEREEVGLVIARRLARRSGARGFGNARDVRAAFERSARMTLSRLQREGRDLSNLEITLEDIIGAPPSRETIPALDQVFKELEKLTGQRAVKDAFHALLKLAVNNHNRELRGDRPHQIALNRLFLGNPGTGKTTTAKLFGRLLKSLGLLSDGEVLVRSASDLVGSVVGESQRKTRALIELAQGKVLLIDEAYVLNDSLYGKQALDTIVEQVNGAPGEDISVVMCGYTREMEEMFRTQNPGLSRRFPRDQALEFADFSDDELLQITMRAAQTDGLKLSATLAVRMVKELGRKRAIPHFGNAGEVQQRLSRAKQRLAARDESSEETRLIEADLFGESDEAQLSPLQALEEFGLDPATLESFRKFEAMLRVHERDGGSKPLIGHMQFIGNAGTGKTTVARLMGRFFHQLGVLARDHVEETSGLDLTGAFVGQTKGVVQERLEAAAGGVLFIDEAYQLAAGQYGSEAVTTLVQLMTEPRYDRDKTIIILAGYESDMAQLMRSNQGLAGRFKNRVNFSDWSPERCVALLQSLAKEERLELSDEASARFIRGCERLQSLPHWANARDIRTLWEEARAARALRVLDQPEDSPQLTQEDIDASILTLLGTREAYSKSAPQNSILELIPPMMSAQQQPSSPAKVQQRQEVELELPQEEEPQEHALSDKALIEEAQRELASLTEELKGTQHLSKEVAGEDSFEAALERLLPDDPGLIGDLSNRDLNDPSIQKALADVINRLIAGGMPPEEARATLEAEVKKLLAHSRKAKRLQKKLEEKLKTLTPIYACGYCGRSWGTGPGQCTYFGPILVGYEPSK